MAVGQFCAACQELGDRGELLGIKTLQQRRRIVSYGAEHVVDVSHPRENRGEDLLTPVVWIRLALQESCPLQPRDDTSNRACVLNPAGRTSSRAATAAAQRTISVITTGRVRN
jgi:hypothetical protein